MEIKLGQEVKDIITGFYGVAVARTVWLGGCIRITVQPKGLKEDGSPRDTAVFDEPQLEIVEDILLTEKAESRHGPRSEATRVPDPRR